MGAFQHHAMIIELHSTLEWMSNESFEDHDKRQKEEHEALRRLIIDTLKGDDEEYDCSNLVGQLIHVTNAITWLLIAPDGSKEGWTESNLMDARRNAIIDMLGKRATVYTAAFGEHGYYLMRGHHTLDYDGIKEDK